MTISEDLDTEEYIQKDGKVILKKNERYKVIFDNGKPFEEIFNSEEELRKGLSDFYLEIQKSDYAYCDVIVLNDKDEDISESQFIQEIIGEIITNE